MFLPIGDLPNPKTTPFINYLLMGMNIVAFFLVTLPLSAARPDINDPLLVEYLRIFGGGGPYPVQLIYERISAYDLMVFQYGFRPAEPSPVAIFTSLFLHANWMHLAGNMLFLYIFGDNVEHRLGPIRYLIAYLLAGLAATLFFSLFVPGSQVPLIGASGAISGVLGFYFFWFPRNQVKVFVFLFPIIMTTLLVPARIVLGFYLLIDNLLPFLMTSSAGGGVAHGAHIGGFLAGGAMAYGMDRLPRLQKRTKPSRGERAAERPSGGGVAESIIRAVDADDLDSAAEHYFWLEGRSERSHLPTAKLLAIGEYLLQHGAPEQALTVFRRLIAERPGDAQLDRAYLGAGKALLSKARHDTSAWHYFLAAIDLARSPELAEEARSYLRRIERREQ